MYFYNKNDIKWFFFYYLFQVICSKIEVPPDYGGGEGSPGSPEMHHCSSTTQPLGTSEVYKNFQKLFFNF